MLAYIPCRAKQMTGPHLRVLTNQYQAFSCNFIGLPKEHGTRRKDSLANVIRKNVIHGVGMWETLNILQIADRTEDNLSLIRDSFVS